MPGPQEALARLVGDPPAFLEGCWGRQVHLATGADVGGLLDVDQVDHILSSMALRAPAFRVVKAGTTLPAGEYTRSARIGSRTVTDLIDVARMYRHFRDGATIVLQGLQRYWPPVTRLCRDLETTLSHPVQANAYLTPPVAQGLRVHRDPHDVFAVQTHGRKQWVLYEGDQQPAPDGAGGAVTRDVELESGHCLYLPKGTFHAARTVDTPSLHLTLGVKATTWADVLRRGVDDALGDPELASPLPPGYAAAPGELAEEATRRLRVLADRISATSGEALVASAARRHQARSAGVREGTLRELLAAAVVTDQTTVRRRPGATCSVHLDGTTATVVLADRRLRLPASAAPAVAVVAARDELRPADLSRHLDEAGRVTLIRRLVTEGLLLVADG